MTGMRLILVVAVVVVVAAVTAAIVSAREPSEAEALREAKRTIFRGLSVAGGASTSELGLSAAATNFLDLHLDVERNRHAIREGTAPRSLLFTGAPDAEMRVEKTKLHLDVEFAGLHLGAAVVPLREVPGIIAVALDAERFRLASIPSDGTALDRWRRGLVVQLTRLCDRPLTASRTTASQWKGLRKRVEDALFTGVRWDERQEFAERVAALREVGGTLVAKRLIAMLKSADATAPAWMRIVVVRTVCSMNEAVAQKFRLDAMSGESPTIAATAVDTLGRSPGEGEMALIEAFFGQDADTPAIVRYAAVRALERTGSGRARVVLAGLFERPAGEDERYTVACALTRLGARTAIPYLRGKLAELDARRAHGDFEVAVTAALLREQIGDTTGTEGGGAGAGATTRSGDEAAGRISDMLQDFAVSREQLDMRKARDRAQLERSLVAVDELRRILRESPEAWILARPRLVEIIEAARHQDVRRRVVKVLAEDCDPGSREMLRERLLGTPDLFEIDVLLLLDERGDLPEARARLEELAHLSRTPVAKRRRGVSHAELARTLVAAHLAMRRIGDGGNVLAEFLSEESNGLDGRSVYVAAAAGLHSLGNDQAWGRAVRTLGKEMDIYVAGELLVESRRVVLVLEYFHRAISAGRPAMLSGLRERIARYETEHAAEIRTLEEVRRRFELL